MARVVLPQSKIRARRKKRRITIAAFCTGVFLLVFATLAWASHAPFMRIDTVVVQGAQTISSDDVQNQVLKDLQGSYLFVFPKNNIFLYPKSATEANLAVQIPTIADDRIRAKNFHTLEVDITERTRKALWCPQSDSALPAGTVPLDCALLDQDGVVYASALSATDTITYFGPLSGSKYPQTYLPADQFHSLAALLDALKALGQNQSQQATDTPQSVTVVGTDVRVQYQSGFTLLFLLTAPGADVYNHFLLALSSDAFHGHTLSDFDYLDLRFGDKLYYKLRNAPQADTSKK